MTIVKVRPLSLAKILAILYGGIGLIAGAIFALLSLFGLGLAGEQGGPLVGLAFGVGAIVALPVFYGVVGFVGGLIAGGLFNLAAGLAGGLEIETA